MSCCDPPLKRQDIQGDTCGGFDFFTILRISINGNDSYTSRQHTCVASQHSNLCNSQRNLDTFESCFLVSRAILDLQNSTTSVLSSSSCLLTPLSNFFGITKNRLQTMGDTSWFSSKIKRSRFWPPKQRLLLRYILIQNVSLDPTQPLKLLSWDFYMQNFDIFARNLISYFQILLNKLLQNMCFNWHHQIRLEKYSKKA